jgi:hypothetical protein
MPRPFCITGVLCLSCAFALSFLVSVSLPFLVGLDITRVHFGNPVASSTPAINEIRVRRIHGPAGGYTDYLLYSSASGVLFVVLSGKTRFMI